MSKAIDRMKDEYDRVFGHIPDDPRGQLEYLCSEWNISQNDIDKFRTDAERFITMKTDKIMLSLPVTPLASRRPRSSSDGHFYVPDIEKHRKLVQSYIDYKGIVFTLCHIDIDIYVEIPSAMTKKEAYLAQIGLVRPTGSDWDNYAKTYCDCIQNVLITNDNLIISGTCRKFYSVKPRVEIEIEYQPSFDCKYNERRITKSKSYLQNIERVKYNEYTRKD